MKKLFILLAIAFFTISINAQQAQPAAKAPAKKEVKKNTTEAKATTATEEKTKCEKTSKSCCSKKA